MSIHPKDVLLYAGGECFAKFGVPYLRQTRAQDGQLTFTRSGAVGPFVDSDGVLRQASADRVRTDWIDTDDDGVMDTPTLLLEAARTNLVTSDDLTAWTASGTPVVTGSVSDPAGGTGAYTVEDDDGASVELVGRNVSFTGGSGLTRAVVCVVRENTPPVGSQAIFLINSGGVIRMNMTITGWTDGEPSVTGNIGTFLGKRYVGNGFWAIYAQTNASVDSSENTHQVQIRPTVTDTHTGSIDVYRVNAFDDEIPSASILDASETRNADTLFAEFPHAPQAMTVYVKFIERGAVDNAIDGALFYVGSATAATDPRFLVSSAGGFYRIQHDNGTTNPAATLAAAPAWGDSVEIRAVLNADGSLVIGQSIEGAAETTASDATVATLASAWAGTRLYVNSRGTSGPGLNQYLAVKVARGVQTMAAMRAVYS